MSQPVETLTDYVLGLLPPDERRSLEAHLKTCHTCQQEVFRLQETFYALPDALPLQTVPDGAWASLQTRRQTLRRDTGKRAQKHNGRWSLAAVLLFLLVGSLGWGVNRHLAFGQLAEEQQLLTAWMNNPELTIRPLSLIIETLPGIVCTYPDGRALLVQKEDPPRGMVYQVWGVAGANRVALGTTARRIVRFRSDGFDTVEVSLEPSADTASNQPTQLVGRLSLF